MAGSPRRDRSLVRASDLSAWAYCRRAWWLANVRGVPHGRPDLLERGKSVHARHGAVVRRASSLRKWAWITLLAGALLLAATVLLWIALS